MQFRHLLMSALVTVLSTMFVSGAGDVTGTLTINAKPVPVRYVYALLHDNAEGTLSSPTQLRILITDREVPIESLYGFIFLPVLELAGRGEVEGVLLQFDPVNYHDVDLTVLIPRALQKVTDRVSIKDLQIGAEEVKGSLEYSEESFASFPDYPKAKFSLRFTSVLHRAPTVTGDLKGQAALNSPQVKALRAIADAIASGDFVTLHKLSSERAARRDKEEIARRGAGATAFYTRIGAELKKLIPGVKRVVIRGDRAVVILPEKTTYSLIFEGGKWKGD